MYLIVGLGNPGKQYDKTRHNMGFDTIDELIDRHRIAGSGIDRKAMYGKGVIAGEKVILAKPMTYMNLSGEAVGEAARFFKIKPENILILHDEIELPLGTLSLKWSGGLGGHNGLRSIKEHLGTADFWRLRFGVGKPVHGSVADFVLGSFSEDEKIMLSQVFSQANILFSKILTSSQPEKLIPEWGKKKVIPETK
ncbi:MAG: aminoacyl-tRNA hydrolase [Treponema sp.]|nr:aminoacyl-tRNA hydrolase [Treponema sp.]